MKCPSCQRLLPILAELISRGDGTYILRPVLPADDRDTWIPLKQASQILRVSPRTTLRWLGSYLVYRRPALGKYEVSLGSAMALRSACNNPEFWSDPRLQSPIKSRVRVSMDALLTSSQTS